MPRYQLAFFIFILIVNQGFCHRLDIAYSLDGDQLIIEAWMGRDEPTAQAEVTLLAKDGSVIQQGTMDDQGTYRIQLPEQEEFLIRVFAGRGHQNELTVTKDELAALRESISEQPDNDQTAPAKVSNTTHVGISTQDHLSQPLRVVIGFIFITSLVAAWFAYRADQRLKAIEKRLGNLES
ncbi:hypothetical protein K8I31_03665 [bacterium]|nr:hypothetical protein [bacterium]